MAAREDGADKPVPPGQLRVPAQQGPRGNDQAQLAEPAGGQPPGQRREHRPVGPGQLRRLGLALEDGELMAQDQDLGILGAIGAGEQGKPAEHTQHHQVGDS